MTAKCEHHFSPLRLAIADLKLALHRGFWLSVLLGVIFRALFIIAHLSVLRGNLVEAIQNNGMCTLYLQTTSLRGLSGDLLMICVLPTLAYSEAIGKDIRTHSFWCWVVRCGNTSYAASKFFSCAVASFASYFLAELLVGGGLTAMIPFYLSSYDPGDAYTVLLNNGQPFVYFLALTCHHALAAALYGGMGMLVSAFVRRDLVGNVIPVTVYFLLSRLCSTFFPKLVKIPAWLTNAILDTGFWRTSLLLMFISVFLLLVAMCLLVLLRLRREG